MSLRHFQHFVLFSAPGEMRTLVQYVANRLAVRRSIDRASPRNTDCTMIGLRNLESLNLFFSDRPLTERRRALWPLTHLAVHALYLHL